jgi:hypothetical protein
MFYVFFFLLLIAVISNRNHFESYVGYFKNLFNPVGGRRWVNGGKQPYPFFDPHKYPYNYLDYPAERMENLEFFAQNITPEYCCDNNTDNTAEANLKLKRVQDDGENIQQLKNF